MFNYKKMSRYIDVSLFTNGLTTFYDRLERTWKILDKSGNETKVEGNYSNIAHFSEGKAAVQDLNTGLWGYIDENGQEVIPCKFKTAEYFKNGFAIVSNDTGLYAYINEKGEEITPYIYTSLNNFEGGYGIAEIEKNYVPIYSLINEKGEKVYETGEGDTITHIFDGGAIIFRWATGRNFLDHEGHLVGNTWYFRIMDFSCGLAAVQEERTMLWGYVDTTGKLVIPCKYKEASTFKNGEATVLKDGKYFIIDTNDNIVRECEKSSDCEVAHIKIHGEEAYIFVDSKGKIANENIYKAVLDYREDLAPVQDENEQWGFVNRQGKEVIPCNPRIIGEFHCGRAIIRNEKGLCGYIDKTGKEVIPCQYKKATNFDYDIAIVTNEKGLQAAIDTEGKIITPFSPSVIYDHLEEVFTIRRGKASSEKISFFGKNGQMIKDLSAFVYTTVIKFADFKKELLADSLESLREMVAAEYENYANAVRGEDLEDSQESQVKSIGVYPGTEQPRA